jgi:hypothetical protein
LGCKLFIVFPSDIKRYVVVVDDDDDDDDVDYVAVVVVVAAAAVAAAAAVFVRPCLVGTTFRLIPGYVNSSLHSLRREVNVH